jgi:hypothetical protein
LDDSGKGNGTPHAINPGTMRAVIRIENIAEI